jgi:hypothetical protein
LQGGVAVWLATDKARWLSGRYVSANWSVEELVERKEEILNDKKLVIALTVSPIPLLSLQMITRPSSFEVGLVSPKTKLDS